MGKKRKDGTCGKTTKGAPTGGAGVPYKGKGTERRKDKEENRERRGSVHGQATRSTAKEWRSIVVKGCQRKHIYWNQSGA